MQLIIISIRQSYYHIYPIIDTAIDWIVVVLRHLVVQQRILLHTIHGGYQILLPQLHPILNININTTVHHQNNNHIANHSFRLHSILVIILHLQQHNNSKHKQKKEKRDLKVLCCMARLISINMMQ